MAPQNKDTYANKFFGTVTESAANTLTFSEIQTNVNIFDKVAWILHRMEWFLGEATGIGLLVANGDRIACALTSSDKITDLDLDNPSVVDLYKVERVDYGAAANMHRWEMPIIRDFTNLPGGGIIIAPRPLYVAAEGASLAAASTVSVRGYFTQKQLTPDEYLELIDFYRIVS